MFNLESKKLASKDLRKLMKHARKDNCKGLTSHRRFVPFCGVHTAVLSMVAKDHALRQRKTKMARCELKMAFAVVSSHVFSSSVGRRKGRKTSRSRSKRREKEGRKGREG